MINLYVKELEARAERNVPITASVVCKEGECRDLGVVIGDTLFESQTNILARHSDGSIRHALITFLIDTIGQVGFIHTIVLDPNQKAESRSFPLPKMDHKLLTVHTEVVDTDGQAWTCNFPPSWGWPMVMAAGKGDKNAPRLKGPIGEEVEWRTSLSSLGGAHPNLSVVIRWRLYHKSCGARVEVVIENSSFPNMADVDTKSVDIYMGGNKVLSLPNRLIYSGQRLRHVEWVGDTPPELLVQQDATYLRELGAIPLVDTTKPLSDGDVDAVVNGWIRAGKIDLSLRDGKPLDPNQIDPGMPNTGDRADIGPFPRWGYSAVNSLSIKARRVLMAADGNGAGAFSVHLRDANGEMGLSRSTGVKRGKGVNKNPNRDDRAHQPCLGYISYLLTGERYYEEELSAWATYCTREWPWTSALRYPGTRDSAWSLRSVTYAAWILPDDHAYKQYFVDTIEANLPSWKLTYMDASKYPLHTWGAGSWNGSGRSWWPCAAAISPWQFSWHVWSLYNTWNLLGYQDAWDLFVWSCHYFQECYVRQLGATYTASDGTVITWDPVYADQYSFAVSKHEPEVVNGNWQVKDGTQVMLTNLAECLWYLHVNESNSLVLPAGDPAPENWLPSPPSFRKGSSMFEEYAMADLAPLMQHAGVEHGDAVWAFIEPYVDAELQKRGHPPGLKQVP